MDNMKRIKRQFGFTEREAKELDDRFYEAMRQLYAISNNINQLAMKVNSLGFVDAPLLQQELNKLYKFQLQVEQMIFQVVKW